MTVRSTGGVVSSRWFQKREMERSIMSLPSSQRLVVRKLARKINDKTGMGYYAALDFIAVLGVYLNEPRGPTPFPFSTKSSTKVI